MSDYYEGSVRRFQANPLSIEHVDTLARRARQGCNKSRKELMAALVGIAEVASSKHLKLAQFRGLERDDLRQEAMYAMLKGLATWNDEKATFRTYAFDRAKYAVSDAINNAHLISIPKQYADPASRGTEPKDFVRLAPETKLAAKQAVQPVMDITAPKASEADEKPSNEPGEIEDGYEEANTRIATQQVLNRSVLTDREKEVLRTTYGLFGTEKKTECEMGKEWGVSGGRIGNLKQRALKKLRVSNAARVTRRMAS